MLAGAQNLYLKPLEMESCSKVTMKPSVVTYLILKGRFVFFCENNVLFYAHKTDVIVEEMEIGAPSQSLQIFAPLSSNCPSHSSDKDICVSLL